MTFIKSDGSTTTDITQAAAINLGGHDFSANFLGNIRMNATDDGYDLISTDGGETWNQATN